MPNILLTPSSFSLTNDAIKMKQNDFNVDHKMSWKMEKFHIVEKQYNFVIIY